MASAMVDRLVGWYLPYCIFEMFKKLFMHDLCFQFQENGNSTESSLDNDDIWKPRMREVMFKILV